MGTDFLVFDREQEMKVTVFDEDLLSADDLLGAASDLIAERFIGRHAPVDETLPLKFEGEPAGDLTISTRWFHLTRDVPVTGISQAVAHGPSQLVLRPRFAIFLWEAFHGSRECDDKGPSILCEYSW